MVSIAIGSQGKNILKGIMLVVIATFLVATIAPLFNVTGTTLTVLTVAPSVLGLGLLVKYLDVF